MNKEPLVLVVDDERVNLLVLSGMLKTSGINVLTAENGFDCRKTAREFKPDVILLDIMMPGESGFDTCRLLREDPDTTDIPIIFISALSEVGDKVRGLELGAVDYITKPFERAEVLARVRLHLKLAFARRKLIEDQRSKLRTITEAQKAILVRPEDLPEAGFAVKYVPALEAGGDFYDVFKVGQNIFCYFIADICGHDLGASFVTSSLKALIRQNSGPIFTPLETMKNMNSVLSHVLPGGRFLTAQGLYLNRTQSRMVLANAGHPPPVWAPKGEAPSLLNAEGDILGAFEAVFIDPIEIDARDGDRIYLYTDGLVDGISPPGAHGRREGEAVLLELCRETADMPLDQAVGSIVDALTAGGQTSQDDVVLMGIEV